MTPIPEQKASELLMDSATKPKVAYRDILIGILTGLDEQDEPDVQPVLYELLDELKEADPFDVALGGFELVNRLAGELSGWTGKSYVSGAESAPCGSPPPPRHTAPNAASPSTSASLVDTPSHRRPTTSYRCGSVDPNSPAMVPCWC